MGMAALTQPRHKRGFTFRKQAARPLLPTSCPRAAHKNVASMGWLTVQPPLYVNRPMGAPRMLWSQPQLACGRGKTSALHSSSRQILRENVMVLALELAGTTYLLTSAGGRGRPSPTSGASAGRAHSIPHGSSAKTIPGQSMLRLHQHLDALSGSSLVPGIGFQPRHRALCDQGPESWS